jgi:predicted PurR-regulated permease PerM
MKTWIVIIIACGINAIIMNPIEKALKKKFSNRETVSVLRFVISVAVFLIIYGIADLLGYGID